MRRRSQCVSLPASIAVHLALDARQPGADALEDGLAVLPEMVLLKRGGARVPRTRVDMPTRRIDACIPVMQINFEP